MAFMPNSEAKIPVASVSIIPGSIGCSEVPGSTALIPDKNMGRRTGPLQLCNSEKAVILSNSAAFRGKWQ